MEFINAYREGNINHAIELANIIDIDAIEPFTGKTLLMIACDNYSICKILIDREVDVNRKDFCDRSALIYTSNLDVCQLLINAGADVNFMSKDGYTALIGSIDSNNVEKCKLLLENGADPHIYGPSIHPTLPLYHAIFTKNFELCKILVGKGANINKKPEDFPMTALETAFHFSTDEIFCFLIDNGADVSGDLLLFKAVNRSKCDICEHLIKNGADVNQIDNKTGWTPLFMVVAYCTDQNIYPICELLIKYGANINFKDNFGDTVLIRAVGNKKMDICKLLIDYGADTTVTPKSNLEMWGEVLEYERMRNTNKYCKTIKEELMAYVWNPERKLGEWLVMNELINELS